MIGSALVSVLRKRKGVQLFTISRKPSNESGATNFKADLRNEELVSAAVKSSKPDVVYHLAAELNESSPHLMEVNILGTRNLLKACRKNAPKALFVYPSSIGILEPEKGVVREHSKYAPMTAYQKSKVQAELDVIGSGQPFVIMRAPVLIGPNVFWEHIFNAARKGHPLIGEGKNYWPLAYYKDFAEALAKVTKTPNPGHIFNFASKDQKTYKEIYALIRKELGVKGEMKNVTPTMAYLAAALYEAYCYISGRKPSVTKTRASIARLLRDSRVSTEKMSKALKHSARHSIMQALKLTLKELKAKGYR